MPNSPRSRQTAVRRSAAVLADAAGEDDHVGAAQLDQVGPQVMPHAGDVDVQGQLAPGRCRPRPPRPMSRKSPLTPLRPSSPLWLARIAEHFGQRLAGLLHDQRQGEGIEIAHAVVLRQAALRAHAHAGGHALPVADGAAANWSRPSGRR